MTTLFRSTRQHLRHFHTSTYRFLVPNGMDGVTSGYIGEILVKPGDRVRKNQVVMIIETGKVPPSRNII